MTRHASSACEGYSVNERLLCALVLQVVVQRRGEGHNDHREEQDGREPRKLDERAGREHKAADEPGVARHAVRSSSCRRHGASTGA